MAKRQKTEKTRRPKARRPSTKQPRTASLPGLEDHAIRPLDTAAAAEYADIRDQRMELTRQEVDLKARTMKLMKKYDRVKYQHNGILIEIEPGEETIKVKVKKLDEELDDSGNDAPDAPSVDAGTEDVEGETLADA